MNLGKFKGIRNKDKYFMMGIKDLKRHDADRIIDFIGVSCVYLLYNRRDELIYVGQSYDLENRFFEGHKMDGKFDSFSIIRFKDADYGPKVGKRKKQREKLERALIRKYRPPFNIEHNPDRE